MPEARIALAQATTYLASAPKSNRAYMALDAAMADIENGAVQPVPEHLKNVHIKAVGAEKSAGYRYPHDFKGAWVEQSYLRIPKKYCRHMLDTARSLLVKALGSSTGEHG